MSWKRMVIGINAILIGIDAILSYVLINIFIIGIVSIIVAVPTRLLWNIAFWQAWEISFLAIMMVILFRKFIHHE